MYDTILLLVFRFDCYFRFLGILGFWDSFCNYLRLELLYDYSKICVLILWDQGFLVVSRTALPFFPHSSNLNIIGISFRIVFRIVYGESFQ